MRDVKPPEFQFELDWEGWEDAKAFFPSKRRELHTGANVSVLRTQYMFHVTVYYFGDIYADVRFRTEQECLDWANSYAEKHGGWSK